ncbi:unnamed protein product [Pylaiella littoralis]
MATRVKAPLVLLRLSCRGGNSRAAATVAAPAAPAAAPATATRTAAVARFRTLARGGKCDRGSLYPYRMIRTFSASSNNRRSTNTTDDDQTVSQAQAELEKLTQKSKQGHPEKSEKLIYEGSITHQVKGLKRVSITTCVISILAVPAVVMFGKESVTMAGQVAVMGTALVGTGSSTLLLNLCVSPYVFRMTEVFERNGAAKEEDVAREKQQEPQNRYSMSTASGRRFRVERMDVFGVRKTTEFSIDEVEPMPNTSRPFVSFKAGDNHYFVQGHDMADKVLLQTLLGRELKDHEK